MEDALIYRNGEWKPVSAMYVRANGMYRVFKCPDCDQRVYLRRSQQGARIPHFYHEPNKTPRQSAARRS